MKVAARLLAAAFLVLAVGCADRPLHTSIAPTATRPAGLDVPNPTQSPVPGAPTSIPGQGQPGAGTVYSVQASGETEPVPTDDDAADDMAIWYNAANPAESRIIGTDKEGGGLIVYTLDGRAIQSIPGEHNNVDLRYGFRLGNETFALVISSERRFNQPMAFKMSDDGVLSPLNATGNSSRVDIYGACMYKSPAGRFFAFITEDDDGLIQQYEITPNQAGDGVIVTVVRTFDIGSQSEGCVADDVHQLVYIGEEERGIWRYGANPEDGTSRLQVDSTRNGNLVEDVEGLTIYYASQEGGYLIASSQGDDRFAVYDRQTNAYIGSFRIVDGPFDGVSGTDGIDVSNLSMGPYNQGLFVVQDGTNRDGATRLNQNFKIVAWEDIASLFQPALRISTTRVP